MLNVNEMGKDVKDYLSPFPIIPRNRYVNFFFTAFVLLINI